MSCFEESHLGVANFSEFVKPLVFSKQVPALLPAQSDKVWLYSLPSAELVVVVGVAEIEMEYNLAAVKPALGMGAEALGNDAAASGNGAVGLVEIAACAVDAAVAAVVAVDAAAAVVAAAAALFVGGLVSSAGVEFVVLTAASVAYLVVVD